MTRTDDDADPPDETGGGEEGRGSAHAAPPPPSPRLASPLPADADDQAALQAAIAATGQRAFERLGARRHPRAVAPALALPPLLATAVAAALALETDDPARAEVLRRTWTEWFPTLLVDHLCADGPAAALFHTPLEPARLPRLAAACAALEALLTGAGADPRSCLPALTGTLAELYPQTHFGRCMPMLYCFPHDLADYGRSLERGCDPLALLDERLAAPLVHELSHLHRERGPLWPPSMEESVAGWLGALALPSLAWPEPGHDHALLGAHLFAQIGQALCHALGTRAVVRAHAGLEPWSQVLPRGLPEALETLGRHQYLDGRAPHLLGDTTRPLPWVRLVLLHAAGSAAAWTPDTLETLPLEALAPPRPRDPRADAEVLAAALRTAWNVPRQREGGVWRIHAAAPDTPVVLDLAAAHTRAQARGDDPTPPTWWLPPALCLAWQTHDLEQLVVTFEPRPDAQRDRICHALAEVLAEPRRWTGPLHLDGAIIEHTARRR